MTARFTLPQRTLHWLMAAMILAMLFIGAGMVTTVAPRYTLLVSIHKPLGIAILLLVLLRAALRLRHGAPSLPADLPWPMRAAAHASHLLLYALMLAMPLIGWSMLSAGGYPIALAPWLHLPPLLPPDPTLYTILRTAHRWLAYLFFATILAHLAAALFHALVRRDGVFASMATGAMKS